MRRLLAILLLCVLWAVPAWADTHAAASCASADVQTAVTAAHTGDTVTVPAGSCTWTTTGTVAAVTITQAITLQGAGCAVDANGRAVRPCGTVITDDTHLDYNEVAIRVNYSGSSLVRITGFEIILNHSTGNYSGEVKIDGGASAFRIDHCVFDGGNHTNANGIVVYDASYGVIDHNTFLSGDGNRWKALQINVSSTDAVAWANALSLGTANAVYMEDNTFTQDVTNGANAYRVVDNAAGGRLVFRYNILNNSGGPGGHGWDTDSTSALSSEIYNNTFNHTVTGAYYTAVAFRGGTGMVFNNTLNLTAGGYDRFITLYYYCGCNTADDVNASCSAAGTSFQATYPGYEQPGRAPSGSFPTQVLAPIYEWNNTTSLSPRMAAAGTCANEQTLVQENRDYYVYVPTGFDGSVGVGRGTLAARPSSGLTAGVGYFATDTNTLYVATGATTWATYYAPYTYPHPLQGAVLPSAPTNVRIR